MSSILLLMFLALGAATAKPLIRSGKKAGRVLISSEGDIGGALSQSRPHDDPSCTMNSPCQRTDGIISSDLSAMTSTMTHCTVDQDVTPDGRWCGVLKNTNQATCEREFTYKNCGHTSGKHTVYYPCQWRSTGNRKCYAGPSYTAPGGVLLADGTRHAETCNTAGDNLFGGEHCLAGETMDAASMRCVAATSGGDGDGDGE